MFIALIFPAQEQTIAYVSQCQYEGRDGSRLDDSISIKTDQTRNCDWNELKDESSEIHSIYILGSRFLCMYTCDND